MSVQHGALLLALGLLTLTVGAVARINHRNGSIAGNPNPILRISDDVEQANAPRATVFDVTKSQQSDDKLKEQLQKALDQDWDLDHARIAVDSVEHGVVTLSGRAQRLSNHVRAVELVVNFPGVQRVTSRFQTSGALSGIDIWREDRGSKAYPEDAYWNAWVVIPIGDDDARGAAAPR